MSGLLASTLICYCAMTSTCLKVFQRLFLYRVSLNKHTIVAEEVKRFVERQGNPFVSAYGWSEWRRLRLLERRAARKVDAVWACSERDRELILRDDPAVPVAVVPNVVDIADYRAAESDDGRTIIYVGAMDWLPNRDAVEFFVAEIMPELLRLVSNVTFVVAGREPPAEFRERLERVPGVKFTGTLPDLRPQIAKAAVCAVPLRIGSGTRLKIIEAAAMAKPVVSTTIGAEGLSLRSGKEIIIADEPRNFAHEIAALLSDHRKRLEIGHAARGHVNAQYCIPALRRSLLEAFMLVGDLRRAGFRMPTTVEETTSAEPSRVPDCSARADGGAVIRRITCSTDAPPQEER